jgi:hypothetical protein
MFCIKKQQLIAQVEGCLDRIAKLARTEAEAIREMGNGEWLDIDKQIEAAIGEKERAIGALWQHRQEHGC